MRFLPFSVGAALLLAGCVPDTQYRYTALTPGTRPIPWDGRGAPGGTVHAEGTVSTTAVAPKPFLAWPELHETALHVTRTSLEGALMLEPVGGAQFGVRGTYAAYDWSEITAMGTMPVPDRPSLSGVGPEMRLSISFDHLDRFELGIAANALLYQVPYAEYTRMSNRNRFMLTSRGSELDVVGNAGVYPTFGLGDHARYGSLFMLVGMTQGFENDGFTNTRSLDGRIHTYGVPMLGGGYGFTRSWFTMNLGLYQAFSGDTQYLPGGWLTIGLVPRLWEG